MYKTILSTQKRRHALRAHQFRKRFWGGLRDLDITSQGVSTRDMINKKVYGRATIDANPASNNHWTFSYNFGGDRYLKDGENYGYDYAIACGGPSDHLWTLEPVDNIPVNLDVKTTDEFDETKYYTTLYTSFPYECINGLEAFYVIKNNGSWTTKSVPNNIVPSNTGVIIASSSNVGNIKPIFEEPDSLKGNLLKGAINLVGDSTVYDSLSMRILGVNTTGDNIAFVSSNDKYIKSNTAYLDITGLSSYSKSNVLGNEVTGISTVRIYNQDDETVYDLSGRKITQKILPKGIYIKGGRKFVVK